MSDTTAPPAGGMRKQKDGSTLHVDGGNANYAWIQHFVQHLSLKGIAGFVLANGAMSSNTSGEGAIRRRLIEADLVDSMLALIDRTHRELSADEIAEIARTYHAWRGLSADQAGGAYEDKPGFCKSATLKDIEAHDFVLTPGRYVGAEAVADDGVPFEEKLKILVRRILQRLQYPPDKAAEAIELVMKQAEALSNAWSL